MGRIASKHFLDFYRMTKSFLLPEKGEKGRGKTVEIYRFRFRLPKLVKLVALGLGKDFFALASLKAVL
jgi:hypothetical protein